MFEPVAGRPGTVLLIEDDQSTRELFGSMLAHDGYAVHAVSNAQDGLALLSVHTPDVILLDLHLPIVNGVEYLRRLRATPEGSFVPVAILTADYFLEEGMADELRTLGARIHFKPVWDSDLSGIVRDLIASRALL